MDRDGTKSGYDIALLEAVKEATDVPVIASGGAGDADDMVAAFRLGKADAVLAASIFHHGRFTVSDVKALLAREGIEVREESKVTWP
jgi:cyclase